MAMSKAGIDYFYWLLILFIGAIILSAAWTDAPPIPKA